MKVTGEKRSKAGGPRYRGGRRGYAAAAPRLFMPIVRGLFQLSDRDRARLLITAGLIAAAIAAVDYAAQPNVSLGYLYIVPILIASGFLKRWQIVGLAALFAVLREGLGPFPHDEFVWTREILVFGAFLSSGLLVREITEGRRRSEEYSRRLEDQIKLRREAEEQLRVLFDSNPAAILIVDQEHRIVRANEAAARMFGCSREELLERRLDEFLPAMRRVPVDSGEHHFRTNMECTGQRADGSLLAADVWFSTYMTSKGPRLAAIVLDLTEELREREDLSLDSLLVTSRVLVGAVLHEIRNLSAAATVAHANLRRDPRLAENEDFRALGTLVEGLEKVASSELASLTDRQDVSVDLSSVLREFQLIAEPSVKEAGASLHIAPADGLKVRMDRHSLLQVLLNLARNSIRALAGVQERRIVIESRLEGGDVLVRFEDSGPGVQDTDRLFQPFHSSAEATGLGLYVSRATLRSFGGELYYEPSPAGGRFVIRLCRAGAEAAGPGTGEP